MEETGEVVIPGFRFYPTEEELITFYLKHKIQATARLLQDIDKVIPELHIYGFEPWDLPQYAGERCQGDLEQRFFFIPRQEKEARGGRPCRLTSSGYWKATGSPSIVYSLNNRAIGIKRTMVFHNGRAPSGIKTKWKMNEYKAYKEEPSTSTNPRPKLQLMEGLSLCRVYVKSNCLRTFDRRPTEATFNGQLAIPLPLRTNEDLVTTSTHPCHPMMLTSLSDQNYNSEEETINNSQSTMKTDDQPLLEWENRHNWF